LVQQERKGKVFAALVLFVKKNDEREREREREREEKDVVLVVNAQWVVSGILKFKKKKKKIIKRGQCYPYCFWPFVGPLLVFGLCGIVSNSGPL
jgi:hypothetical protein